MDFFCRYSRLLGLMVGLTASWASPLLVSASAAEKASGIQMAVVGPAGGQLAAYGDEMQRGAQLAVDDINSRGGINGEKITLQFVGDKGDKKSGVAIAEKLAASGVRFVIGHYGSTSSIYASKIYAKKNVLMVSPSSTNPMFTELGLWNTIRTAGRDDVQGAFAGEYIARKYPGQSIAVLYDGTPYGEGLATKAKAALKGAGMREKIYATVRPGKKDYSSLVTKMSAAKVDVAFFAGLSNELGQLIRQTNEAGLKIQFVTGDGALASDLPSVAGPGLEGTLMAFSLDDRANPTATDVVDRLRAQGLEPIAYALKSYAAVQVVAKGAEIAASSEPHAVAKAIRSGRPFPTVLGDLSFDIKGDRREPDVAMYVWKKEPSGEYRYYQAN